MAKKKYYIILSDEQKDMLHAIIEDGTESDRTILRAKILLESDEVTGAKLSVSDLAEKLNTSRTTIQTTRTEFGNGDLEESLFRKKRLIKPVKHRITTEMEQQIIKLAESAPPEGKKRWTFELLRTESIRLGIVDQISQTSLRNLIHKTKENI